MTISKRFLALAPALFLMAGLAQAAHGKYKSTVEVFKNSGTSASFFHDSVGYAVFPTIGEGAFVVGGAGGKGRVYVHGRYVGDTTMTQVSVGFQAGGKAFSQIIFFQDQGALSRFESGSFQFTAGASAVAITTGAEASTGTTGSNSSASASQKDATTNGVYQNGMAVFTIAKGGLLFAAAIAGQKFTYTPLAAQ